MHNKTTALVINITVFSYWWKQKNLHVREMKQAVKAQHKHPHFKNSPLFFSKGCQMAAHFPMSISEADPFEQL